MKIIFLPSTQAKMNTESERENECTGIFKFHLVVRHKRKKFCFVSLKWQCFHVKWFALHCMRTPSSDFPTLLSCLTQIYKYISYTFLCCCFWLRILRFAHCDLLYLIWFYNILWICRIFCMCVRACMHKYRRTITRFRCFELAHFLMVCCCCFFYSRCWFREQCKL